METVHSNDPVQQNTSLPSTHENIQQEVTGVGSVAHITNHTDVQLSSLAQFQNLPHVADVTNLTNLTNMNVGEVSLPNLASVADVANLANLAAVQNMNMVSPPQNSNSPKKACLVKDCTNPARPRGRFCWTHSKMDKAQLVLTDPNVQLTRGRPPKPIDNCVGKRQKIERLDKKIVEFAGGEQAANELLRQYAHSAQFSKRVDDEEAKKEIFAQIGRNMIQFLSELPPASPFRKPLIQALGRDIKGSVLETVLPVSRSTIFESKSLSHEENLLVSMRYKPNVKRRKGKDGAEIGEYWDANNNKPLDPNIIAEMQAVEDLVEASGGMMREDRNGMEISSTQMSVEENPGVRLAPPSIEDTLARVSSAQLEQHNAQMEDGRMLGLPVDMNQSH